MKKNLYGKNVFVTGASSGIGRACARMFAMNGCDVTGVSRNTEEKTEHFTGGGSLLAAAAVRFHKWMTLGCREKSLIHAFTVFFS